MESTLIFQPFPFARSCITDMNAFNQLFQDQAAQVIELSNSTKMQGAPLSSFRPYIQALSTKRGSQIQAVWNDPFNPSVSIPSRSIETEIAGTIWNYISGLHSKILKMDSRNAESLKNMKKDLEEINACNDAFEEILSTIQHPIFTPYLAFFIKLYQTYILSYWQLSCINTLKPKLAPSLAVRCIEDLKVCQEFSDRLNKSASSFLYAPLELMRSYVEGFCQYRLASNSIEKAEYGVALSHLSKGIEIVKKKKDLKAPSSYSICIANDFIYNALVDTYNKLQYENRNRYGQTVPDTPPLPRPYSQAIVGSAIPLFSSDGANLNIPTTAHSNSGVASPPNLSMGQVPAPSSSFGSPVPYPSLSYPSVPQMQMPPASQSKPPSAPPPKPANPIKSTEELNIKEWDIVCALKNELLPRIQKAMSNPNRNISSVAQTLFGQFQAASQIDPKIQESINNCKSNLVSADTVNPYIKQADVFYTQLEERLNILERTGK